MGYTVFALPEPEQQISNGISGPETRTITPIPRYPSTFVQRLYAEGRYELWEDTAGNATIQDVDGLMPGWIEQLDKEIRLEGGRRLQALAEPYQGEERETWANQQREAEGYAVDKSTPTPMINAMAVARRISVLELMAKITENVNLFRAASGQILGQQQWLLDRLYEATTVEERLNVTWGNLP